MANGLFHSSLFQFAGPKKHLVMESENNKIKMKMKPWGNNMNHTFPLYFFKSSKVIALYI
jgi:hypothetical protein